MLLFLVLEAILSPEASANAGTYIVTLKCKGEALPDSNQALLVVGVKYSRIPQFKISEM